MDTSGSKDVFWNLFERSGAVNAYLIYKLNKSTARRLNITDTRYGANEHD